MSDAEKKDFLLARCISVAVLTVFILGMFLSVYLSSLPNGDTTVYITHTGEKYHKQHCQHLRSSKVPLPLEKASSRGYDQCSICEPPKYISEESRENRPRASIVDVLFTIPLRCILPTAFVVLFLGTFFAMFIDEEFWKSLAIIAYFLILLSSYALAYA